MHLKRIIFTTLLSGFGAAMGMQIFVWRMPWLIQEFGGVYFSQSAPYAASGAIGGVLTAEALLGLIASGETRKAKQRIESGLKNESLLQSLTLDQQAVLFEMLRKLDAEGNPHE